MNIPAKKLHRDAILPVFAHADDAGMDLFALEECVIRPRQIARIRTGIALEIPDGYAVLIWDKSGLAQKHGLKTLGGVVDAGYRGDITVGMANLSSKPYRVNKGDKIAQMLIQRVERPRLVLAAKALSKTARDRKGFGSTGK